MTDKEEIKDGLVEEFYDNGQLKYRVNFKNGQQDGLWEYFDENGNLFTTEEWKDGEVTMRFFEKKSQLKYYLDDNGNKTRVVELFHTERFIKNNRLYLVGETTPFTGICEGYWCETTAEYYDENDDFIEGMGYQNMLNYREAYKDGLKHGTCEYYAPVGDLIFKENYKFGLRHGECEYDCDLGEYIYYSQYLEQGAYYILTQYRRRYGYSVSQLFSYLKKKHSSTPFLTGKCIFEKGEMVYSDEEELRKGRESNRKRREISIKESEKLKERQNKLFS